MVRITGATDRGRVRGCNEDAVVVDEDAGFAVVADGVGGNESGAFAAWIVVDAVATRLPGAKTGRDAALVAALQRAGERIATSGTAGAGASAVAVEGDEACWANIGDGRIYHLHQGVLTQISADDTLVAEAVRRGKLSPAEAVGHPHANILLRALGTPPAEVSSGRFRVVPGDVVLLVTDGVWRAVSERTLRHAAGFAGDSAVFWLLRRARATGTDNATAAILRF